MIGGSDIVVEGAGAPDEAMFIIAELKRSWPMLRVQDVAADTCTLSDDAAVATMTEFFIYKSQADFESWAGSGASNVNADRMIHVVFGSQSTTLVTDGPGSNTHNLASVIASAIRLHRIERGG